MISDISFTPPCKLNTVSLATAIFPSPTVLLASTEECNNTFFLDTGASINVTNDLANLNPSTIQRLKTPLSLSSIGGQVMLTHVGRLRHFPFPFNLSYYGPNLTANLLSLGNFQHLGGWYGVDPTNHHRLLLKSSLKGATIGTATLSTSNLLPVILPFSPLPPCPLLRPLPQPYTVPLLRALHTPHPTSTPSSPQDTTTTPPSTSPHDLTTTSPDITVPDLDTTLLTSHSPGPDSILHQHSYNTEQRLRASLALQVHKLNHNSDLVNGISCECGVIPLPLTRADFTAMSNIYGECGACVAGKNSTVTHGPTSTSPPPTSSGALLHADLITLPDGSTVLLSKDDHCGYVFPIKLLLGKSKASLTDGWDHTRRHYNSFGWLLSHVNTDSEEAFKASHGPLQDRGIHCTMTPPLKHEKSIERTWQTLKKKMAIIVDSLPYILPPPLHYPLLQFACHLLNTSPNNKFPYSSPYILLQGVHSGYTHFPHHLPLPFGTIVRSLEAPGIEPQTGLICGITPNSVGAHLVYYPAFHNQRGATILSRAASQLTVLTTPPLSWRLVSRSSPAAHLPIYPPTTRPPPIHQPVLQPVLNLPPFPRLPPPSLLPPAPPSPTFPTISPPFANIAPAIHHPPPPSLPSIPASPPPATTYSPALAPLPYPAVPSSPPTIIYPTSTPSRPTTSPSPLPPTTSLLPTYTPLSSPPTPTPTPPSAPTLPPSTFPPPPPPPRYSTRSSSGITTPRIRYTDDGYHPHSRLLLTPLPPLPSIPTHPSPLPSQPTHLSLPKPGILRRLDLSRKASERAKPYAIADKHRNDITVNNSNYFYPTTTPQKQSTEFSLRIALTLTGTAAENVIAATNAELTKCLDFYKSFRPIAYNDIERDAIRLPSLIFFKRKDLLLKGRLVVCGTPNHIPPHARGTTYAGAADPANIIAVNAAYRADAIKRNVVSTLITFSTDIPSAYLQNTLTRDDTSGHQVVSRLPTHLPHPLAGKWVELLKGQYGLPWSNCIHARELTKTLATAGFYPAHVPGFSHTPIDPYIYHCVEVADPLQKSTIAVTIDDIQGLSFYQPHFDRLHTVLRERYGEEVTFDYAFSKYAGQQYHAQPDGGLTVECSQYIRELLTSFSITTVEGASTPTGPDFFHTSTDNTPFDTIKYQKATGALTWVSTRGRPDIAMAANYLSSFNHCPTAGHWLKILRIFRYLYYTVELGLTYYTTDGPVLHCSTDVSYNSQTNGDAQAGVVLSIGRYSAPIYIQSGHLGRKIPLGPCQAEYMGMTNGVKAVTWFRNLLAAIGYPQLHPTPLYQDNMSAKNLAESPSIHRRSRHIEMFEHANRQAVKDGVIEIFHQPTADQRADILTKPMGPLQFIYQRSILMNHSARTTFNPIITRKSLHST